MLVRDAADEDLPQILALVNAFLSTTTAEWTETPYTLADRRVWLATHRSAGEPVLVAEVDGENTGSIRFHERCGFVEVARKAAET